MLIVWNIIEENANVDSIRGSPLFLAPDQFQNLPITNSVDVYSFGVSILAYFIKDFGKHLPSLDLPPQFQHEPFFSRIIRGARFVRPIHIPDAYWNLYRECTDPDPLKRPRFQDLATRFEKSPELLLPGTNIEEYKAYIEKMKKQNEEATERYYENV